MSVTKTRERLLASSMISCALVAAAFTPALAQTAAKSAPAADPNVSEVVVTGTRIPSANMKSISPVQVVTDKEFKLGGRTNVSDLVNTLPQNIQNNTTDFSSTSNPLAAPGGISTANLRGLGATRTLVLVDGRRLGFGDANTGNHNPSPDLNQIPAQLVDRVEVLTGGSSATYGSDAIAGVVNFIMKQNFEGLQIDGQMGVTEHNNNNSQAQSILTQKGFQVPEGTVWDGQSRDLSFVMGTNAAEGKANVTAYLTYHNQDPVTQGTRDFSACKVSVSNNVASCTGSPNSNQFIVTSAGGDGFAVKGNQFVDWDTADGITPPQLFNSNPYQYLLQQDTRYSGGFFAHYDINDYIKPYGQFSFMNDRTRTEVAPSGMFEGGALTNTGGNLVNCDNPLLSAQQAGLICTPEQIATGADTDVTIGRRNIEGGGRASYYEHMNYRAVGGIKGDVPGLKDIHYDLYGSYYYTSLYNRNDNYFSLPHLANALQVVNVNGVPTCKSVVAGTDSNCVPYNIFSDGGVTPKQVAYLNEPGSEYGTVEEVIVSGGFTGNLGSYGLKSPWSSEGLGFAIGFERRTDTENYQPDTASLSGDLSGFGGAGVSIDRSLGVSEFYTEFRAPIVQDMQFFKSLNLDLGYRYSKYTTSAEADTFKAGMDWSPISDFTFRASYQRAIRAPNILELYNPQSVTNTSEVASDPCAGTAAHPATATLAECQRTGVTAAEYGDGGATNHLIQCPASQCATLQGGNTALAPEKAKTIALGFTFTPTFLRGFSGSIDYYRIHIDGEIDNVPLEVSLDNCLADGNPVYCKNIVRSATGNLFGTTIAGGGYIVGTDVNIGAQEVSGIDFQAAYSFPVEWLHLGDHGSISLAFNGSYLNHLLTQPLPTAHTYDCAGLFGATCQTFAPKWRHNLRISWQTPWNLLASVQWRYIGSASLETNTNDPTLGNGSFDAFEAKTPDTSYIDLSATYTFKQVTLRAGVDNLFDKDPPIINAAITGTGTPNTYTSFDVLGRVMFVGFTANF